jgi:hypothetical protein
MIICTLYTQVRTFCVFSRNFIKCSEYTCKRVACNGNFLEADFNKLSKEKKKLKIARLRVIIELTSLDKQVNTLKKA